MRHCTCSGVLAMVPHASLIGACLWCRRWTYDANYRLAMGGIPKSPNKAISKYLNPCVHRGDKVGETTCDEGCGKGSAPEAIYECSLKGKCTALRKGVGVSDCCRDCPDRTEKQENSPTNNGHPANLRTLLALPEGHFNGSIAEWNGRTFLASRCHSRIHLSELDSDLNPLWTRQLVLNHPGCRNGQEDPRLYHFAGKLRLSFAGIWADRQDTRIRQCWTEFDDDLQPGPVHCVEYSGNQAWEKNWGFFEGPDGEHLVVYSISPHVVLRVDGNAATLHSETTNLIPWSGGYLRGGAPPVRSGDVYTAFFHGNLTVPRAGRENKYVYSTGYYEFEAAPSFRVIRQTPEPILWAQEHECHESRKNVKVIFPSGAILRNGKWIVSQGVGDYGVEVVEIDSEGVSTSVTPSPIPEEFSQKLDLIEKLPGWCLRSKAEELVRYTLRERPRLGVEIGVFGGRSLLPVASVMQGYGGVIYGVDPWTRAAALEGMTEQLQVEWWQQWDADVVFRQFSEAVSTLGLREVVRIVQDTSANAVRMFVDGSIDYLSIDGNHTEASALRDAKLWWPKLRPGGVLWWDDAEWPSVQPALRWLDSVCDPCRTTFFLNETLAGRTKIYRKGN